MNKTLQILQLAAAPKGFAALAVSASLIAGAGFMAISPKNAEKTGFNSFEGSFFAARSERRGPAPEPREAVLAVQGASLHNVQAENLRDAVAPAVPLKTETGADWAEVVAYARQMRSTSGHVGRRVAAPPARAPRQGQFGGQLHTVQIQNRILRRVTAQKAIGQLRAARHFAKQGAAAATDEGRLQAAQDSFEQQAFEGSRIASDIAAAGARREGDLVVLPMIAENRAPRVPSMEMMR